ncbi:hypothetical protein RvY_02134-1 [Ramazzottius varieornatus]|uniref:Mpv17-like protein 2 n=1 Tax=Ramazzottius varieornatus TaxID=947166 RepID=A0A1D1UM24_RAMVA|nr:hypothetical protein RvY_02134-1 [Ramazzottius varieornatus]
MSIFVRTRNVLFGPRYLLMTNTALGGGLLGLADVAEQTLEIKVFRSTTKYDWPRAGRMAATGLLVGSLGHGWYKVLDKALPGIDRITVIKKVVADLLIAGPATAWVFFWGIGTLERRPLKEIWDEFKLKFPYIFALDCVVWPPAQAINFFYLAPQYRMVYVNTIVFFWDILISYIKHQWDPSKK